ncbi:endonuclease domain-containing 1 protein-like [Garra rufa]|uniref:endonuclease domain-containing 1 protein-like n=1 Tax=Garra rufa TaxID=137080 RepID=UPI003CCECB92
MHLFVISVLLVLGFPFIMPEVVDSFNTCNGFFLNGQPPVIPGILKNSVSQDNNRYKLICQKYKNAYRFATLYDTVNKIPVFSAYKYTGKGVFKRPKVEWMIESQAISKDYRNNNVNVSRGHLFPCSHAADVCSAKSTFTLTNTVPQKKSFNEGSWSQMEDETKNIMNNCKNEMNKVSVHVLTGAIPGKDKLNRKVNIPSHMWMAFCCYKSIENKWVSKAYWAPNIEEENKKEKQHSSLSGPVFCQAHEMDSVYENSSFILSTVASGKKRSQCKGGRDRLYFCLIRSQALWCDGVPHVFHGLDPKLDLIAIKAHFCSLPDLIKDFIMLLL